MPFTSTMRDVPATRRSRVWRRAVLLVLAALWIGTAFWQTNKTLPAGLHVDSPWYPVKPAQITFIADITSADAYGRPVVSQAIFDEVLKAVRSAHRFVVLDYFLFNSRPGLAAGPVSPTRELSGELRDALIERRRSQPNLRVLFITDPINEIYGDAPSRDLKLLRAAGVDVVVTDLDRLRDSNYVYSSIWRLTVGWWSGDGRAAPGEGIPEHDAESGWPNPLDESATPGTFTAWSRLLNFKANQRKVLLADDGRDDMVAIVGSANPHDASSSHSNVALRITGPSMRPLLESELAIARFSGWKGEIEWAAGPADPPAEAPPPSGEPREARAASPGGTHPTPHRETPAAPPEDARVKVLTEGAIRAELLDRLDACVSGDSIDIAMFYLADRGVIEALLAAARRGVNVRVILDPNKDAFGEPKAGIPNQPVASELVAASDGAIHLRWYRTHAEQFHTKLALIYGPRRLWLTVGSANLTRRNLLDYNLEANVAIEVDRASPLALQTLEYFETLWTNRASLGIEYSADFGYYADPSQLHYWLYRVMEGTGVSTF